MFIRSRRALPLTGVFLTAAATLFGVPAGDAFAHHRRDKIAGVKVVNVGGPLNGRVSERGMRADFRHVDLDPGPNTVVADVNKVDLSRLFGHHVRFLRASNVPFRYVPGGYVVPENFALQARRMGVQHIVVSTGIYSVPAIKRALEAHGYEVRTFFRETLLGARLSEAARHAARPEASAAAGRLRPPRRYAPHH